MIFRPKSVTYQANSQIDADLLRSGDLQNYITTDFDGVSFLALDVNQLTLFVSFFQANPEEFPCAINYLVIGIVLVDIEFATGTIDDKEVIGTCQDTLPDTNIERRRGMYAASYVWAKVLVYLEQQLSEIIVSAWFDDAEVVRLSEKELVIYSPSEFRQERIRANCAPYIEDALKSLFHTNAKLVVWGETEMKASRDKKNGKSESYFNPQFVFENFIAGSSNEMPLKVASAVAAAPGMDIYNPVFFYGPPGVGKTHLLYSIANSVSKQHPDKKIVCIKGDQFTNDLVKAIQGGSTALFREKYREADVLLVDDIQFIAGKESTQEEFFHTFNELYENGKQIVLTADRKPTEMASLEDRLRSRFGVGIMVAITPSDYVTRMLITRATARKMNMNLSSEIVKYIATNLSDNIRQIRDAYKK